MDRPEPQAFRALPLLIVLGLSSFILQDLSEAADLLGHHDLVNVRVEQLANRVQATPLRDQPNLHVGQLTQESELPGVLHQKHGLAEQCATGHHSVKLKERWLQLLPVHLHHDHRLFIESDRQQHSCQEVVQGQRELYVVKGQVLPGERGSKHFDLLRVAKLFPEVGDIRFLVEILQLVLEDSEQSLGVRRVAEPFGLNGLNPFPLHSILLLPHLHSRILGCLGLLDSSPLILCV